MKRTTLGWLLIAVAGLANAQDKPNVVIMLADNVGYGDIGAFGGGEIRGMPTPRIDSIAAQGLRLTQYLVEPACTPSRAALISGRYSQRLGLATVIIGGTPNTLQASEVTLGELFKSAGYATGMTGKWHLGASEQSWPTRQGFDEYHVGVFESSDGALYRDSMQRAGLPEAAIAAAEPYIWESDATGTMKKARPYTLDFRGQVEGEIAKASVEFIERRAKAKQPFFLYVGFTNTHYPIRTAPEFVGKSRIGPYGDAIMELDYRTGQILDAIKAAGVEDNTIVIWISDNAAAPTGGPSDTRFGFNGPFRGELGDATEGSIRTIGMVKWPGKIAPRVKQRDVCGPRLVPDARQHHRREGAHGPTDRRRGSKRVHHRQTGEVKPRKLDHLHRRGGRRGALAAIPDLPEGIHHDDGQSADDRSRRPPRRRQWLSGDLQYRGRSARRGERRRHQRLGGRPLPEVDRRIL